MSSEIDGSFEDYWRLTTGNFILLLAQDEGLKDVVENMNTMPLHAGLFVLGIVKHKMNKFIRTFDGFESNDVHYQVTDSLFLEGTPWDKLNMAGLNGKIFNSSKKPTKKTVVLSMFCFQHLK